jgi:hypothetical protein
MIVKEEQRQPTRTSRRRKISSEDGGFSERSELLDRSALSAVKRFDVPSLRDSNLSAIITRHFHAGLSHDVPAALRATSVRNGLATSPAN